MTIIAWDGKTLAADRRMTTSWGAHNSVTKIEQHDGALSAISGKPAIGLRMREWWKAGAAPEAFPKENAADDSTLIIITRDGIFEYTTGPFPIRVEDRFCAWGSGRDFAQVAMHCGKDAREAVEITCLYSVHCGNGIDFMELP